MNTTTDRGTATKLADALRLHQQGAGEQAAHVYLEILADEPDHFDALHLLGVYAMQAGDFQSACDLIGRAIEIRPRDAMARSNLGVALQKMRRYDDALTSYRHALEIDPANLSALNNSGSTLLEMRRLGEAAAYFERALRIDASYVDALNNLGHTLVELARFDEALLCLDRVLELAPGHVAALFIRGNALQLLNRTGDALASYRLALEIDPHHVDANFNAGVCRLLEGDLHGGWPLYEWRWNKPGYAALTQTPTFTQPRWRGETPLAGKTLLLYAEQGFGDTLQFCRHTKQVAAMGAIVILRVQPALKSLLNDMEGVHRLYIDGDVLPAFDLHCPLLSLPLALEIGRDSIPNDVPYIYADPMRVGPWMARLGRVAKPRIGIVWAGSAGHANDTHRSIPLRQFMRVVSEKAQFISLQKDVRAVDRILLERHPGIAQFADEQVDFADTAALIATLDLVISVDTSVAHLAAAMGKPVWILLPFAPDWRWMLGRDDSPWYPSARLFRQAALGDWDGVLDEVGGLIEAGW